jgi:C4-type Zn-finger protein
VIGKEHFYDMEDTMHCPSCDRVMLSTGCQVIQDENGAMTITRWRCRPCHETAEEIRLRASYRGQAPMRISYAVADPQGLKQPTRSFGGSRRGPLADAVAR